MYRHNYLFHQYHDNCYPSWKPFTIEIPRPGKYKVIVTLKTELPLQKVSIYTGAGNLAFTGCVPAGVFKQTIVINIGNSIQDDVRRIYQERAIAVTVAAETDCLSGLSVSEIFCPAIYIAGTADGTADTMHKNCHSKWQQMLTAHSDHTVAISDYSRPGLTTESFQKKGLYAAINEYSRPGDFYLFQFDPAGQPMRDWAPGGVCRRQLVRYIVECRERLAYPVLLTPTVCHNSGNTDDYTSQLQEHCLDAYREVSKLTATPVIELHELRVTADDAYVAAGLVAKEIARVCGTYPERGYRFLAKCMG